MLMGMFAFVSCGSDDDGAANNGGTSGGGTGSFETGKFQGPKRVFGDNLLSSYGNHNRRYELTYDSNDFVTSITRYSVNAAGEKNSSTEFQISYSDNHVIVTKDGKKNMSITIGNNGFAEFVDWGGGETSTFEYDADGHVTKFTEPEDNYVGTLTWQNGNMIEPSDNESYGETWTVSYTQISNVAGLYVHADIGGDVSDFYDDMLYYMGLLGKGTANLVQGCRYSDSSTYRSISLRTEENDWTLDAAGRPTKCITNTTKTDRYGNQSSSTSTYFWTYR